MFEEAPFGEVGGQLDGAVVGGGRAAPAGTGEEIGAGGVVRLVVLERGHVERVEGVEAGGGAPQLADGDGPVEGGHRVGAQGEELVVEGDDLGPVGGRGAGGVGVDGGDGGLDLERTGLVAAQAARTRVWPSVMSGRSQRVRSWSARRIIDPSGAVRAGRRASVSSVRARRPTASGSSGMSR